MKNDCWFHNWFDSEYYHLLYNKRDDAEADFFITNLCSLLKLPKGALVWDIACGKGRHAMAFAEKGFHAVGTDLSVNSIREAEAQNEPNTEFYVHDMRKPFRINYFDCALNLFTSIGYFDDPRDNYQVFKNVCAALKPGGFFVLDFFNSAKVRQSIKPEYNEQRGNVTFHITKIIEGNIIRKKINFDADNKKHHFEETVTLLTKEDFEKFASPCDFNKPQIFGSYALEPFNEKKSDRLILIFKKAN